MTPGLSRKFVVHRFLWRHFVVEMTIASTISRLAHFQHFDTFSKLTHFKYVNPFSVSWTIYKLLTIFNISTHVQHFVKILTHFQKIYPYKFLTHFQIFFSNLKILRTGQNLEMRAISCQPANQRDIYKWCARMKCG